MILSELEVSMIRYSKSRRLLLRRNCFFAPATSSLRVYSPLRVGAKENLLVLRLQTLCRNNTNSGARVVPRIPGQENLSFDYYPQRNTTSLVNVSNSEAALEEDPARSGIIPSTGAGHKFLQLIRAYHGIYPHDARCLVCTAKQSAAQHDVCMDAAVGQEVLCAWKKSAVLAAASNEILHRAKFCTKRNSTPNHNSHRTRLPVCHTHTITSANWSAEDGEL